MAKMIKAAAVSLLVASLPVAAQNVDDARTRFKRGTELYDEGNYRGALVEFQRAFETVPNFRLLYNIGLVHLQLQDYAQAVKSFTRYLNEGGTDVPQARREEVTKEIERLTPRIGQLTIQTAPGAEVLIDDESVGFAPLPGPVPANTGRHKVSVLVNGKESSRVVDVGGQQNLNVVIASDAVVTPPPSAEGTAAAPSGVRASVVVAWLATAVLAASAVTFAGLAFNTSGELVRVREAFEASKAQLDALASRTLTFSVTADALAGAAVITGVIALWVTLSGPSEPQKVSLSVGPAGVAVTGRF